MRKLLTFLALMFMLSAMAHTAYGQTPIVQVYFDPDFIEQTKVCNVGTVDSAYVVASNFNIWLVGIEYAISYPAGITWMGDSDLPTLIIGNTVSGISEVWTMPQNAYTPLKLATINYYCAVCTNDSPIAVIPHPVSGYVRATRYPDLGYIYGIGMTSIFCPLLIPVENSSWGGVKSLYQ